MCSGCASMAVIAYGFGALVFTGCTAISYYFRIPILTPLLGTGAFIFSAITFELWFIDLPYQIKMDNMRADAHDREKEEREERIVRSYLL